MRRNLGLVGIIEAFCLFLVLIRFVLELFNSNDNSALSVITSTYLFTYSGPLYST